MSSKIELATRFAEQMASDNSHGYSQANRWGNPDFDCSSLVIMAWEKAGVPVKSRGATYTGNMRPVFLACGFKDVTASINLNTGAGLKRGDVLLNEVNHVVMYVGSGKIVHARSSEGNSLPGDQSGNEIRVQSYWNYPWDCVLRYPETINEDDDSTSDEKPITRSYYTLKKGDGIKNPLDQVKAWQNLMLCWGFDIGTCGADGEFGNDTAKATILFQKKCGLTADGIVDENDWKEAIYVARE